MVRVAEVRVNDLHSCGTIPTLPSDAAMHISSQAKSGQFENVSPKSKHPTGDAICMSNSSDRQERVSFPEMGLFKRFNYRKISLISDEGYPIRLLTLRTHASRV